MTLKKLIILGGAIAGAAYLKDKNRRQRFMDQARGFVDQMKTRATEAASEVRSKASELSSKASDSLGSSSNRVPADLASPSSFGSTGYVGSRSY